MSRDEILYPSMVIRSQAETIELQEKEIKRLNKLIDSATQLYLKELSEKRRVDNLACKMFNTLEENVR